MEPAVSVNADLVTQPATMRRSLTLLSGCAFIVGTMIGSGIFASPGSVLVHTHSAGLALIAWLVAGVLALMGCATYAELGTCIPESGGEYAYLFRCYGQVYAFLFSWTCNIIIKPSGTAIVSIVCGQYITKPFYLHHAAPEWLCKGIAYAVLFITLLMNCTSIQWSTVVQRWLTFCKLCAIALVVILGLITIAQDAKYTPTNLHHAFNGSDYSMGQFGVAVISGLFAYDGWNNLNFVTEELINPLHNMPRALAISIPLVVACYVLANLSYFAVLPLDGIADFSNGQTVQAFVTSFGDATMGLAGQIILPLCIASSSFGCAHGGLFVASRLIHASARRGDFPAIFSRVYGKEHPIPIPAILFNGSVAAIMIAVGNFDVLVNYFSVAAWIFYCLASSTVLVLRWKEPNLHCPFRVWLIIPFIFCLIAAALVAAIFYQQPVQSAIAVGCILSGLPFYFIKSRVKCTAPNLGEQAPLLAAPTNS